MEVYKKIAAVESNNELEKLYSELLIDSVPYRMKFTVFFLLRN